METKSNKINVLIVDDHFVVRMGLKAIINIAPDMTVVAEASTGQQAVELFRQHHPDVTLMDLRLPRMNGIETTIAIRREFPNARIIVLTSYDGDEDIYRALQAGAQSYQLKNLPSEELLEAMRTVAAGRRRIPPPIAARLADRLPRSELTPRELEVLEMIAQGLSNKDIAAALSITEFTVKFHVKSILHKLNVSDRTHAAISALQRGIIHME